MNADAQSGVDTRSDQDGDFEVRIGDVVRVKQGVMDPDMEASLVHGRWCDVVDLGGWVGIVTDFEESEGDCLVTLEWDSRTLNRAPRHWLRFMGDGGMRDESEFGYMTLGIDDIEPAKLRDTAKDRKRERQRIATEFAWREKVEELYELIGAECPDECDDEDMVEEYDDVTWAVTPLNQDGDMVNLGEEHDGLDLLRAAHRYCDLEYVEGSFWINGTRRGRRQETLLAIKATMDAGMKALLVRGYWADFHPEAGECDMRKDVVVGLSPRGQA